MFKRISLILLTHFIILICSWQPQSTGNALAKEGVAALAGGGVTKIINNRVGSNGNVLKTSLEEYNKKNKQVSVKDYQRSNSVQEVVDEQHLKPVGRKRKTLKGRSGSVVPDVLNPAELEDHQINPESPPAESIGQRPECLHDIRKYCRDVDNTSDVELIICLQKHTLETEFLSTECQNLIWYYKFLMSQDHRFSTAAKQLCQSEINLYQECSHPVQAGPSGFLVSCLIDHLAELTPESACAQFLKRMEWIMFSDWRLIGPFAHQCKDDIQSSKCGRTDTNDIHDHSQGEVVECLLRRVVDPDRHLEKNDKLHDGFTLSEACQHQVIRVAELQSDDFHFDRPLFYACRVDRELVCSNVEAGGGKVLACLIQQRLLNKVSPMCAEKLLLREQLMARDFKLAHPLVSACATEIGNYRCTPLPAKFLDGSLSDNLNHFSLASILLCLENAAHDHEVQWRTHHEKMIQQGKQILENQKIPPALSAKCVNQVTEHRRMLFSDYRIAPEIVLHCSDEITQHCGGSVQRGGETLHCLMRTMEQLEMKGQDAAFGAECSSNLRDMVKMADIDSNYRVDGVLERDCKRAIDTVCSAYRNSEIDMMTCLMDRIESTDVSNECQARLIEVQYFMARDFTLDNKLFQACADDAVSRCMARAQWFGEGPNMEDSQLEGPDTSGLVLPCLYRHAYRLDDESNVLLTARCTEEVKRVMHERAISVKLMPQIENRCISELGTFCSDKVEPGQELECLQDHYDDEKTPMSKDCRTAIREFTQIESKDIKLNRLLSRACSPAIESFCPALKDSDVDSIDVMQCLQDHKREPQMTPKCAAYVHHYELVSMKDYRFSAKFVAQCKLAITQHCPSVPAPSDAQHANDIHSKGEIIRCLSRIMFEQHLLGEANSPNPLSAECKKQLRKEYLLVKADPVVDPAFLQSCSDDLKKFCSAAEDNIRKPVECLRSRKADLSTPCRKFIFQKEEVEFNDNRFDYTLMRACRAVIQAKCADETKDNILACLKLHRKDELMTEACRSVVKRRMKEQASDIRLQPHLRKACKSEMASICEVQLRMFTKLVQSHDNDTEPLTNAMVTCLRRAFSKNQVSLSSRCQETVKQLIMESEIYPELDPPFYGKCKAEIGKLCSASLMEGSGHHSMLDCLKAQFHRGSVSDPQCISELERRTNEEFMDIDIDVELHEACQSDVQRHCGDMPHGNGQIAKCLVTASQSISVQLTDSCRNRLEERKLLWKNVLKRESPLDFNEMAAIVQESPVRNSFFSFLAIMVLCLFVLGLICGRVTKRVHREMKIR